MINLDAREYPTIVPFQKDLQRSFNLKKSTFPELKSTFPELVKQMLELKEVHAAAARAFSTKEKFPNDAKAAEIFREHLSDIAEYEKLYKVFQELEQLKTDFSGWDKVTRLINELAAMLKRYGYQPPFGDSRVCPKATEDQYWNKLRERRAA